MSTKFRIIVPILIMFIVFNVKPSQAAIVPGNFIPFILHNTVAASNSEVTHKVQKGDTLWKISQVYAVDISDLYALNNLSANAKLDIGKELRIPAAAKMVHSVQAGETLWDIANKYQVGLQDILNINERISERSLAINSKLLIPDSGNTKSVAINEPSRGYISKAFFEWPITGVLTSGFGERKSGFHHGIDIAGNIGDPIKAAEAGEVTFTGNKAIYGLTIVIKHSDGIETRYAHLSKIEVKKGQKVNRGERIGQVGNTGRSTGPHLHFEVLKGQAVNPMTMLSR